MSACRNGSPEIVKRMLAAGAKPDLQGKVCLSRQYSTPPAAFASIIGLVLVDGVDVTC